MFETRKEINAVRHRNSVFHQLSKHIPWHAFEEAVERHGADYRVRNFRTKDQFLALLFAQFSGMGSLRGTVEGLQSHEARLYHAGTKPVARSTFSDANAKRPFEVYRDVFETMVKIAGRGARRHLADTVRLIDATKVRLSSLSEDWARFSKDFCAVKIHMVYDPHADLPASARVTPDNVNDITVAQALKIEPGVTYVFDMGYFCYQWWADLDAGGCRFVTRFRVNTPFRPVAELPAPTGANILSDHIGHLTGYSAATRKCAMEDPVREIRVRTDQGKILRLMTNDLDAPAEEIAALYKQRWEIELFFKWIKQNLKIKRFIGVNENAIKTQIYIALIAYLILHAARNLSKQNPRPQSFARLVRVNIMNRKTIDSLTSPPKQITASRCENNLELALWA